MICSQNFKFAVEKVILQEVYKLAEQYWTIITADLPPEIRKKPISERQLRDRLKKICHSPVKPASFIFQIFPQKVLD
jgi:hypothetical protein